MTPEKAARGFAYAIALAIALFVLAVLGLLGWKIIVVLAHWAAS